MTDINFIILFPKSFIFGIGYMEAQPNFEYEEINIFLGIIQLQFKWQDE
jgi:hypothetical protein